MKKVITQLFLLSCILISQPSDAQLLKSLGDKVRNKIDQRANKKVDKAIDKGLDKADGSIVKKEIDDSKVTNEATTTKTDSEKKELSYTSKYDFVPGEKIVTYEDFSYTEIGDFPSTWNTNATAEVVTINTKEGKWLKLNKEGIWFPEMIKSLPENFTLEFDLGVNNRWNSSPFILNITNLVTPETFSQYGHYVRWQGIPTIHLEIAPFNGAVSAWSRIVVGKDGNHAINNTVEYAGWDNNSKNFAHVALWRQNQRLRVYVNGEKVWDIPKAFDATAKYNAITTAKQGAAKKDDYFLLGNIRLAVGGADTRNKLVTEGKFVSRGILFDSNSDRIKPESHGALKDIANVLKENSGIKVKIVGHTDSDGDDKANLDLSKRRAIAVKEYLSSIFEVNGENLETDGKGESVPADKNTTAEGKANNRRVEFIKI